MKKLLFLLCLMSIPAVAEPETPDSQLQKETVIAEEQQLPVGTKEIITEQSNEQTEVQELEEIPPSDDAKAEETFETIIYKVEKEIIPMPDCQDEKLTAATNAYITEYFNRRATGNITFRRRRHFILHNLDKFAKENIANYKTEETRPVSDIIAELKVNKKVLEENMLLCKNQSKNIFAAEIYLLVYPIEKGYKVIVINLNKEKYLGEETSFEYEK